MTTELLMQQLREYGADLDGIMDRFLGDEAFYMDCFGTFFEDEHFFTLEQAIAEGRYQDAFESAHALKGLSGNLGLTPYYHAMCTLVDSLRTGEYDHVKEEFGMVADQYRRLEALKP